MWGEPGRVSFWAAVLFSTYPIVYPFTKSDEDGMAFDIGPFWVRLASMLEFLQGRLQVGFCGNSHLV